MASEFTINQIIQFAQISQYLAANEKSSLMQLKSGSLIGNLPTQLHMEGYLLQNMLSLNPTSPTLRGTGEYVLSLCGKYLTQAQTIIANLAGVKPIITGPNNQSVNVGSTAIFSVTVVSATTVYFQWFLNGVAIPGAVTATYQVFNAQLLQSGGQFSVIATNAAGQSVSNTATLTVTNSIILSAFYTDTDPHAALLANTDTFAYQFTVNVTHNQAISIPIPSIAAANKFWVWRVISTEQDDNTWFNTALNSGQIPDSVFYDIIKFGGNSYYSLRNASSFDSTQPLILSKV